MSRSTRRRRLLHRKKHRPAASRTKFNQSWPLEVRSTVSNPAPAFSTTMYYTRRAS